MAISAEKFKEMDNLLKQRKATQPTSTNKFQEMDNLVKGKTTITQTQKPSLITSLASKFADTSGKFLEAGSDLLFGSTKKTVGGLITGGIESAKELITGKKIENRKGLSVMPGEGEKLSGTDAAFTMLELYPGGGILSKSLKGLTEGSKVAKYITKFPEAIKSKAVAKLAELFKGASTNKAVIQKSTNIAKELLEGGKGVITSKSGFIKKASKIAQQTWNKVDDVMDTIPESKMIETAPIIEGMKTKLKNLFTVGGVVAEKEKYNKGLALVKTFEELGKEAPFRDVRKFRQIWDTAIKEAGGYGVTKTAEQTSEIGIKKALNDSIREELAKASPELDKLNKTFNFWKTAEGVMKISKGSKTSLLEKLGEVSTGWELMKGGVTGVLKGKSLPVALGVGAMKLFKSPLYKSVNATTKYKLADYIIKGDFTAAKVLISKLLAGVKNISPDNKQENNQTNSQ